MVPTSFLATSASDGRALLAAARTDWERPVPHCPEWDAAGLVRHTGGIFLWMAAIVASRERVGRRSLDPAPERSTDLPIWYLGALDQVIEGLGFADPESGTWTFSSVGDQRVGWWCRRLAVEVAIHRFDAEHALATAGGQAPRALDADVAVAGVEEFVIEFLPGLVTQEGIEGVGGTLELVATDGPAKWRIDLDRGGVGLAEHTRVDTTVRGTRSDLLLWLTNRGPSDALEVVGSHQIVHSWNQLRR